MHAGLKLGIGLGVGAIAGGGIVAMTRAVADDDAYPYPYDGSPVDAATDYPPYGEPMPGGGTSPGDDPISMPVRGLIDPPGWFDDYPVDGQLHGNRLDAKIDPRGWWNDVHASGRVDYGGFETRIDPPGWGGSTTVRGARVASGYAGSVDRSGLWNDVNHPISETVRGAQVLRQGRFDESLTPGFLEASWRSEPVGRDGGARRLTFDPPGWANDTTVTLEGNVPAGVEATIAAHLYDQWKAEQERQEQYPDPDYPDPASPGDDPYYYPGPDDYPQV